MTPTDLETLRGLVNRDDATFWDNEREALTALLADYERMREQNVTFEDALRFYADERAWRNDTVDIGVGEQTIAETSEVFNDHGKIAKDALRATLKG